MHSHENPEAEARMPFGQFFIVTGLQFAAALLLFRFALPGVFFQELGKPWMILLWTFLFGLPLSLFEYLYHRYLLHSAVLPFLGAMHRAHSHHHGLTPVKAAVTPHEPAKLVPVDNRYPVEHEHQEESMMFPAYSIAIFYAIFLVLLALPFKLLFPAQPIVTSVLLAVTLSYSAYEVWHGILHLPYERFWQPLMKSKRFGAVTRYVYSFHLMHHWRPTSNLAVVGFWGFAIWDHLFRTHRRPERMPVLGAQVNFADATLKKPLWPIALFDKWQANLYRGSRKIEKFFINLFTKRATEP